MKIKQELYNVYNLISTFMFACANNNILLLQGEETQGHAQPQLLRTPQIRSH
jgi:hypothetical protein